MLSSLRLNRTRGSALVLCGIILLGIALMTSYARLDAMWKAYAGALGTVLFVLGLPPVLFATEGKNRRQSGTGLRDANGQPVSSWYFLLSEPVGGYSLSRVQFLIWFLPALAIWVGVSIAKGGLIDLDDQWLQLLGFSGATTVIGTLMTPAEKKPKSIKKSPPPQNGEKAPAPAPAQPTLTAADVLGKVAIAATNEEGEEPAKALNDVHLVVATLSMQLAGEQQAPAQQPAESAENANSVAPEQPLPPPDLGDIVEDWDHHGDVTRYQYLLLSLCIAASVVIAFLVAPKDLPAISPKLWQFVAASSGAYLGTKGMKLARPKS